MICLLLQLGQLMYNYNKNSLPHSFDNMFPKNQSFHTYPTRQSNEFHLPRLRTVFAQNTFIYTGSKIMILCFFIHSKIFFDKSYHFTDYLGFKNLSLNFSKLLSFRNFIIYLYSSFHSQLHIFH